MADETKTLQVIDNFDYLLFFGKNIEDPDKEVPDILPLHAKQNVFVELNKKKYSMSLTGLKFTRKIYEPGLIEAEVTIIPVKQENNNEEEAVSAFEPSFKQVEELFLNRQVELAVIDKNIAKDKKHDGDVVLTLDSATTIAKNYYVFMMIPQIASLNSKREMYVKLTIHSIDKLMDIDKYCKAYSVKKLCSDKGILASELGSFGIPSSMLSADINNLRNLTYDKKDGKVEKIQPYLVQYNETFYAFMVRTANRCGEYFYFEDGKLTLGLPANEAKTLSGYDSVTLQGYTDGPVDVGYYSRDSVKDDGNIRGDLNFDPIQKDEVGYPSDAFPTKRQYNAQLAGDEYIFPLEDKKYTNLNRELGLRGLQALKTMALKVTSTVTTSEDGNPIAMLAKLGTQMAMDSMNAAILMKYADDSTLEKVKKSYGSNKEQYDNGRLVAFSSLDEKGWIGRKFYGDIRKKEEELHHKIICIDMETKFAPVSLGDRLHVEGLAGDYIVIQIQQIADINWSHDFTMFNPSKDASDLYSGRQSMKIYAIPMGDGTVMPPVAPVPMYRKAGAQTAFVVDSSDNKYQGRVRIVYPWQPVNEELRRQLLAAQESLKEAQKTLDNYKKMILDEMQYLSMLKNEIAPDIEKLKGKPAKDVEQYCKDLEEAIKKHEESIRQLEEEMKVIPESILIDELDDVDDEEQMGQQTEQEKQMAQQAKQMAQQTALENKREEIRKEISLKIADEQSAMQKEQLRLDYLKKAKNDPDKAMKQLEEDQKDIVKKKNALEEAKNNADNEVKAAQANVEKKAGDWDKEVKKGASPWVRVATPMATTGGGVWFTPNTGDEVLVNYDNDNVERPYVVGSVYSKNTLAPGESVDKYSKNYLQKKASMMLMSPNGQHISFVAPKDGWKFVHGFSPALKQLQFYFPDLKGKDLDWGSGKDLAGGIFMGDRFGLYELSMSSHDRKIKINSPYGNVEIGAFSGITIKAPNGDIKISGKNVTIEAGNKLSIHSGKNIKKGWSERGWDALKAIASTALDSTLGSLPSLKFVDMAIVRSVLEVFMRPIDGTLNLKSNNYVMLEAGKGKAQVPLDRYCAKYQKAYNYNPNAEEQKVFAKIGAYIGHIDKKVNEFRKEYFTAKKQAYEKKKSYEKAVGKLWHDQNLPDVLTPSFSVANAGAFLTNNEQFAGGTLEHMMANIEAEDLKNQNGPWRINGRHCDNLNTLKGHIQRLAEDYGRAIVILHDKAKAIVNLLQEADVATINQSVLNVNPQENAQYDTKWIDTVFKDLYRAGNGGAGAGNVANNNQRNLFEQILDTWTARYEGHNHQPGADFMSPGDEKSKLDPFYDTLIFRRKIIANFIYKLNRDNENKKTVNQVDVFNKYFAINFSDADANSDEYLKKDWKNVAWLESTAPGKKDSVMDMFNKLGEFLTNFGIKKPVAQYVDLDEPYFGWAHQVWNDKSGQILFSSEKGATYAFERGALIKLDMYTWGNKESVKSILKSIK